MGTNGCFLVDFTIVAVYVSQTPVESPIISYVHAIHHETSKLTYTENDAVFIHH